LLEQLGDISWQDDSADLQEPPDHLEHADELQKKWKTAAGQLWQAGPHRLISGDSTKAAMLALLWHGVQRVTERVRKQSRSAASA
jgi:hypothetical protein